MNPARRRGPRRAFTLLEMLLALALVALLLVAMSSFLFSLGELWGRRADVRLLDQHVRAVTRFLAQDLRTAALPPFGRADAAPFTLPEVRPRAGLIERMFTFELPAGSRLCDWPGERLPEVVCSLQVRGGDGLLLLWQSRLERGFGEEAPRETLVSPLVTGLAFDYYDPDARRWTTENLIKLDAQGQPQVPGRLRLTFTHGQLKRESLIAVPAAGAGLPAF